MFPVRELLKSDSRPETSPHMLSVQIESMRVAGRVHGWSSRSMLLLLLLVTPPTPPHMWGGSRAGAIGLPTPPRGGGKGVAPTWCHRLLLLLL